MTQYWKIEILHGEKPTPHWGRQTNLLRGFACCVLFSDLHPHLPTEQCSVSTSHNSASDCGWLSLENQNLWWWVGIGDWVLHYPTAAVSLPPLSFLLFSLLFFGIVHLIYQMRVCRQPTVRVTDASQTRLLWGSSLEEPHWKCRKSLAFKCILPISKRTTDSRRW